MWSFDLDIHKVIELLVKNIKNTLVCSVISGISGWN
jgi:hypothetical protein